MRMMHDLPTRARPAHRALRMVLPLAITLMACGDYLEVTNPGPVQDDFLKDPNAFPALVNGAGRETSEALNWIAYTSGAITRELHPAGSTGSFGISPDQQRGILRFDDLHVGPIWDQAQRARWVAEAAVVRLEEGLGAGFNTSTLGAQALLWAGYANRLLGENMCEAVINGGGRMPRAEFLNRAEAAFTRAMQVAQGANQAALANAARAGRASVRVHLNKWAEAAADANGVPTTFVHNMTYFDAGQIDLYNRIHEASRNAPYRAHTQWQTWVEDYFKQTGDPRVRYNVSDLTGDAAIGQLGRVPWHPQQKHATRSSPIRLSSGREMRLIEAENLLRNNDWQGALNLINSLRTGLTPAQTAWTASSATEVWTHLKRERAIELWLEGRRMGDMFRWQAGNAPGQFHTLETAGGQLPLAQNRTFCFPIPESELQTNPNL